MKRLLLTALIAFSSPAFAHESSLPGCNNDYRHNCYDTKKLSNGLYRGEFKNNLYHGQGTRKYSSGNTYVGDWVNGEKNGNGSFLFSNGDKYIGTYKNDERVGNGKYVFANGSIYEGEFKNYTPHGIGTMIGTNGVKYKGDFQDGTYIDSLKNSKLPACPSSGIWDNCFGSYTYSDGKKYVGEWKDDNREGYGISTEPDGSKYVGTWKDNTYHNGTFTRADGTIFTYGLWGGKEGPSMADIPQIILGGLFTAFFLWFFFKFWWKGFSRSVHSLFFSDDNKKCAWCKTWQYELEFKSGEEGSWYWRHANKDGSRDKRSKNNCQLSNYASIYECKECSALTGFMHKKMKVPETIISEEADKVFKRILLKDGVGKRKGKDWHGSENTVSNFNPYH